MLIVDAELEPKKSKFLKGKTNNKENHTMPHLKVTTLKDAETIQVGSTTVYVLEDGSLTDNRIGTVFSTLTPHTKPLPQHLHRMHEETFFVTQGTIRFAVNEEQYDVKVGDYVVVPVGAPHTFSNPFDEPAAFLSTFTPAYYVNYFRELGKTMSAGKEPSADDMSTIRSHYATELA